MSFKPNDKVIYINGNNIKLGQIIFPNLNLEKDLSYVYCPFDDGTIKLENKFLHRYSSYFELADIINEARTNIENNMNLKENQHAD